MAKLMNLITEINGVGNEADAKNLMSKYIMKDQLVDNSFGAWATNCNLAAEFVVLYLSDKKIKPLEIWNGKQGGLDSLPEEKEQQLCVCVCECAGHSLVVAKEGNVSALLHGWNGQWSIFPALNQPPPKSYNFWGALMGTMIKNLLTDGDPTFQVSKEGLPKLWDVRRLK